MAIEKEYDFMDDEDPGNCPDCGESWEMVRPGKSQPVCECHLKCGTCEGKISYHYHGPDSKSKIHGWYCDHCDR